MPNKSIDEPVRPQKSDKNVVAVVKMDEGILTIISDDILDSDRE